jgi:hypothetical protein
MSMHWVSRGGVAHVLRGTAQNTAVVVHSDLSGPASSVLEHTITRSVCWLLECDRGGLMM